MANCLEDSLVSVGYCEWGKFIWAWKTWWHSACQCPEKESYQNSKQNFLTGVKAGGLWCEYRFSDSWVSVIFLCFVLFFKARLHNRQSVTVLTSWKVSSTGIPTRNHTNGASWKQDSSQVKLKGGQQCDLTLETWKHTIQRMDMYNWQSGVKKLILHVRIQRKVHCTAVVRDLTILKRRAKAIITAAFWQFTICR